MSSSIDELDAQTQQEYTTLQNASHPDEPYLVSTAAARVSPCTFSKFQKVNIAPPSGASVAVISEHLSMQS